MGRPLRLDFAGAMHHVTSRGNNKCAIFLNNLDRKDFLFLLGEAKKKYGWVIVSVCLMTNHFHLLVETPKGDLSKGMQWLKSQYARRFNKRHNCSEHLFGERFWSGLVQKEAYYLQVIRYILLNPVKAGLVKKPQDYPWSSLRGMLGLGPSWGLVDPKPVLARFGYNRKEQRTGFLAFLYEDCRKEAALIEKARVLGDAFYRHAVKHLLKRLEKYKTLDPSEYQAAFGKP